MGGRKSGGSVRECPMSMISIPASAIDMAQQSAVAAVAVHALAQVAAQRASETAEVAAARPQASAPAGVGGLVDQTA